MEVTDHADSARERNKDLIRLHIQSHFGAMPTSKLDVSSAPITAAKTRPAPRSRPT